jgi:hypothetical protein
MFIFVQHLTCCIYKKIPESDTHTIYNVNAHVNFSRNQERDLQEKQSTTHFDLLYLQENGQFAFLSEIIKSSEF